MRISGTSCSMGYRLLGSSHWAGIFDRSSGAYSINDFLATTVTYKGLFSKRALADRKRKTAGGEPPWLDDYLKTAWEPSTADLEGVAAAIKPAEAKYAE